MNRILFAGLSSGSGKTAVTCGCLRALQKKGISAAAFKCGPDYIDPMFHQRVLGIPGENLDLFFADAKTLQSQIACYEQRCKIAVLTVWAACRTGTLHGMLRVQQILR